MTDWILMRVKFLGINSRKIMRKFELMAKQDQRLPKKNVGLFPQSELELEFMCLIARKDMDLIEYVVEEPNIDTLKLLADYYQVSFELYHTEVNGYAVGYGEYCHKEKDFELFALENIDFSGCVFKDNQYHYEGEIYPNKYSLRKYLWIRAYRGYRIGKILQDID